MISYQSLLLSTTVLNVLPYLMIYIINLMNGGEISSYNLMKCAVYTVYHS